LIIIIINEAADELAEKLNDQYNYAINFKTDVPFIIIRYYSLNIEIDIINREYKNRNNNKKFKNGRLKILIEDEVEEDFEKILFSITIKKFIYDMHHQIIITFYGIANRYLKKIELFSISRYFALLKSSMMNVIIFKRNLNSIKYSSTILINMLAAINSRKN
jgi:hypothetical protein